jgi:hypothetical protein
VEAAREGAPPTGPDTGPERQFINPATIPF